MASYLLKTYRSSIKKEKAMGQNIETNNCALLKK